MWNFSDLLKNFFTHKDFLPSADQIPGTMFTPLHFAFSALCITAVILGAILLSKKEERAVRVTFASLWILLAILEVVKITWETLSGAIVSFEWTGILPLYPCSIFLYAMPFAVWGKNWVRYAACGYVCSLGFLGGAINFVYPATVLGSYSCISFAGFHTFLYHGVIVFCALTMLISGYHSYKKVTHPAQLLLPAIPFLAVSLPANLVNFSRIDSDYMFFKLESFIFAPIGAATADWLAVILVYCAYLIIHALPYLPFLINNKTSRKAVI
ncbi:MAG: YwaF family protein [Clostridia bacterium]|nr:YwaF family protein [Clostridia bacterium]